MTPKELLKNLGYDDDVIVKILEWYNNSLPETLNYYIEKTFNYFIKKGYTKDEIIKMTKTLPTIFGYSEESLNKKYQYFVKKGYTLEEIVKMTKTLPTIFGYSEENLNNKYQYFIEKGYTPEEIIKMTKTLPALFSYSEENIEEKLNFYNDINLSLIAINDTKKLMQSVELSYARYMYFEERGITIDESNYIRLFYNNKKFTKQYGITKEELFEKYKYDDEKRKKVK